MRASFKYLACIGILYGVVSADAAAQSTVDPSEREPSLLEEFTVGRHGRPILLPVDIRGETFQFLLDTGAAKTVLDSSLRSPFDLPRGHIAVRTSNGEYTAELFDCPPAALGNLNFQAVRCIIYCDLAPIRYASGKEIFGVLGTDFLRHFAIEIDFDSGRVRFWSAVPEPWTSTRSTVPLAYGRDARPEIEVLLSERIRERFILDTGANVCSLRADVFDALCQSGSLISSTPYHAVTVAGALRGESGHLDQIQIAEFAHRRIRVDRDPTSTIGLQYLARYLLLLDFPGGELHLRRGNRFAAAERTATTGLSILQVGSNTVVVAVQEGSTGDKAGIQSGDVITAISGMDANTLDLFSVGEILTSDAGRPITLVVRRDENEFVAVVTRRSRLRGAPR